MVWEMTNNHLKHGELASTEGVAPQRTVALYCRKLGFLRALEMPKTALEDCRK